MLSYQLFRGTLEGYNIYSRFDTSSHDEKCYASLVCLFQDTHCLTLIFYNYFLLAFFGLEGLNDLFFLV